jgi:hypothetical protein
MGGQLKLGEADPARAKALTGPRDLKPVGSPDWCYQTIYLLRRRWERMGADERQFEETKAEIVAARAWEKVPVERPYGSLEALLEAEIGLDIGYIDQRTEEVKNRRLNGHGGDRKSAEARIRTSEARNQHSNGRLIYGEGSQEYLTARIARDRPDILERMKAGEFKSVRAAAMEAGIVKERVTFLKDPAHAAAAIKRHFSAAEVAAIKELL